MNSGFIQPIQNAISWFLGVVNCLPFPIQAIMYLSIGCFIAGSIIHILFNIK